MDGIAIYIGGVISGAMLVAVYHNGCRNAVARCKRRYIKKNKVLKAENDRLKLTCMNYENMQVRNQVYQDGYDAGRRDPMTEAERFAIAFQGRNAFFRGPDYVVK